MSVNRQSFENQHETALCLGEGRLRVKLRLNSLEEVERWVLGFGKHATVVEPEELKQRLFQTTEELWQRYGGPVMLHDA